MIITSVALAIATGLAIYLFIEKFLSYRSRRPVDFPKLPPEVPHKLPFIGSLIEFGLDPMAFLLEKRKAYGDCFTFMMWGRKMTYCLGPEGNNTVFNAKLDSLSASDAYRDLTVPVFGEGVFYDVSTAQFMEQKRLVRNAFTTENLKSYVALLLSEAREYCDEILMTSKAVELDEVFAQLTIRTAARCLLGGEVRSRLDDSVAPLYHDLDNGFSPITFLFPWLPLPLYFKRDAAQKKMANLFMSIIQDRRAKGTVDSTDGKYDMMSALMQGTYKDGTKMSDRTIAHALIGALMGGQHTSSSVLTWTLAHLAVDPDLLQRLLDEQREILSNNMENVSYETLRDMPLLDCCVRECLRLHPPIIQFMRHAKKDVQHDRFVIPKGHYVCASPAVSQVDPTVYNEPEKFMPHRWIDRNQRVKMILALEKEPSQDYGWGAVSGSAKSHYLPFGAGRHRCVGEQFGYLQIKTVLTYILHCFEVELVTPFPKPSYSSMMVMAQKPVHMKFTKRPTRS